MVLHFHKLGDTELKAKLAAIYLNDVINHGEKRDRRRGEILDGNLSLRGHNQWYLDPDHTYWITIKTDGSSAVIEHLYQDREAIEKVSDLFLARKITYRIGFSASC